MDENGNLTTLIAKLISKEKRYCVFLGAGFSKDAGIKTGWEILLDTLKPLYINENNQIEGEIDDLIVEQWYNKHPIYSGRTYSQILEINHQTPLERKIYLNKFFENAQPGESHKILAELIQLGYFKFVFTTNFDDLLEKALSNLNIDYDLITCENDIEVNESWEKTKICRIFKLHGDYKKSNLKNTEFELQKLDKLMSKDFQYIIDRYGLIFIGYSGRDQGIMNQLIKRKKFQYPIYWQYVKMNPETNEYSSFNKFKADYELKSKSELIFIQNDSAATFLSEIKNGIEKLGRYLYIKKDISESYKEIIINSNIKKLNAFTIELIDNFKDLFNQYLTNEDQKKLYVERYDIFLKLIKKIEFIFYYLEDLLEFNVDDEKQYKIFIEKVIRHILYNMRDPVNFIRADLIYYVILNFTSILLKYKKIETIDTLYSYNFELFDGNVINMIDDISFYRKGWSAINKQNYVNPRYELLFEFIPSKFNKEYYHIADTFLTLYTIFNKEKIRWYNCSGIYDKYFLLVFKNSFEVDLSLEKINNYIILLENYFNKAIGNNAYHYNGISKLINYLKLKKTELEKNKNTNRNYYLQK